VKINCIELSKAVTRQVHSQQKQPAVQPPLSVLKECPLLATQTKKQSPAAKVGFKTGTKPLQNHFSVRQL
jgi:hypothetical protein